MNSDSNLGICGSLLIYEENHNLIQACGAKYNKWLARSSHIGALKNREFLYRYLDCKVDFTVGASMIISKQYISTVGVMCEDYFLYFEELDWIFRANGKFKIAIEPLSVVYHKQGASTGATGISAHKSKISQYYQTRGRILFTKKFFFYLLPIVLLSIFGSLFFSWLRGDKESSKAILLGAFEGCHGIKGKRDFY
jgi:GT2 family glycosyltransferase